jgi:adenine-specific DNA-methyltransferase
MTNKEKGLKKIQDLVVRFKEHQVIYKKIDYNETQTRRDFIDPFFKALGWDIDNEQGLPESYREVIHEDKIKVSGGTKAPDYSFRLTGKEKLFFLEAKKPNINIKDHIDPAYQIKRYGWNAKMTVSVLTDFEELSIYDCTKEPNSQDSPAKARLNYITYDLYEKEWDFLWNTLSKEAAQNGGFDEYLKKVPLKKGAETVDKKFLKSLDEWRTLLAENISKENKQLDEEELNFVVQQTLDRIIFLRICEDRSIEPYGRLKECLNRGDYYENLLLEFKQADDKYNSGLFDFKKDKISQSLKINNKTLKTIISQLYYPECPYEFSVLSVEILGSAYEQFLGKTITINNRGKAVIELKPEVRKAGGVYYTPQYVVEYIVANTIGKLCENKTPTQVAEIKIVDPACGSGSFLLGAYQYLLNWHKDYYLQNPNKKKTLTPDGNLTTLEKKKILLNNIYGVDIDANAVEVTKLSLLLKCMEGETQASIAHQMKMFNERVLPTLDENIKSGNSLIDTDYYDNEFDFGEERKIKPFNWQEEFSKILPKGFDAVIGNPPYIKERGSKEIFEPVTKSKLGKIYHQGKMDFWYYFIHRGIDILKSNGYLAFITNSYWMRSDGASKLIDRIEKELTVNTIVDFDNYKVFEDVSGKHNISIFTKGQNKKTKCQVLTIQKQNPSSAIDEYNLLEINNENLFSNSKLNIQSVDNIFENCDIIDNHFDTSVGVQESTDKVTKTQKEKTKRSDINIGDGVFVLTEKEIKNLGFSKEEKKLLKPYVNTLHVKRYALKFENEYLLYLGKQEREDVAKGKYPNVKKHLDNMREFITSSNAPYGIHRTREQRFFEEPKLICKGMFLKPEFYFDDQKYYCGFSFSVIIQKSNKYNITLLLALMNSKLGEYWFNLNGKKRGVGVDIGVKVFRLFPLPKTSNKDFSKLNGEIIKWVVQLTELYNNLKTLSLHSSIQQTERQIKHIEDKINTLVYQLYELKKEEIELIERN